MGIALTMAETPEQRCERARDALEKFRAKRALIAAMERLDCIDDAALIAEIVRALPAKKGR